MRTATIKVTAMTPYSQSKALKEEKKRAESYEAFETRVWKDRMHVDSDGHVFVPPVSILNGMACAAAYLSKGGELKKKGNATWSQNFTCGLSISEGPTLLNRDGVPMRGEDGDSVWVYCHADGKRSSGTRVWRCFPVFEKWTLEFVLTILDDTIPEEVFNRVVEAFGLFNGIGRYRPQNGGYLGRFVVDSIEISDVAK